MDGKLDILSGCYWTDQQDFGEIKLFEGTGKLKFKKCVSVNDQDGNPIVNFAGEGKIDPENNMDAICTQQHAVDFDGDGDLDLVVGGFSKRFFLHENVAKKGNAPKLTKPRLLGVTSPGYHAAPHLADWDADGDLDLLTGTADGGAYVAKNVGTRSKPIYKKFETLIKPNSNATPEIEEGSPRELASATRLWVADYNQDGLMDLVIGDNLQGMQTVKGVDQEKVKQWKAEAEQLMEKASKRMEEFFEENSSLMDGGPDELPKEKKKEYEEIEAIFMKAQEIEERYMKYVSEGSVWVALRKPATTRQSVSPSKPATSTKESKSE